MIIDLIAHPRPPVQTILGAWAFDGLDDPIPRDARQPVQLLGQHLRFQPTLPVQADVLEVAPTAAPRAGSRAAGRHSVGAGLEHLDGIASPERVVAGVGDPDPHPFSGQRVPDEDHPSVQPGDAVSAVRDRPDLDHGSVDRRCAHEPM